MPKAIPTIVKTTNRSQETIRLRFDRAAFPGSASGSVWSLASPTALQQLLVETLTNPETLAILRAALGPRVAAPPLDSVTPVPQESFWVRCRRTLTIRSASWKHVAARGIESTQAVVRTTCGFVGQTVDRVRAFRRGLTIAWRLKKAALIGIGIGTAVVALSLVSHPLAAILSGIGAATTAFVLQIGLWFRKTTRAMIG